MQRNNSNRRKPRTAQTKARACGQYIKPSSKGEADVVGKSKRICPLLDAAKGKLRGPWAAGSGFFTSQDIDPGTFIGDYSSPVVLDKEFAGENPDGFVRIALAALSKRKRKRDRA
ncbi:uncharacterized protein A1O5_12032 [Cladophialophora psammophila CBS 110553]|uniref:Uncharacterized protein n=1 Tax=Cladophialophora psammophila CBS 110553 TaxID=1182543 RepID=W9W8B6_9EURO|nr:uncharacterized protein A1O5_12032 [Cladophialophora psammophila CBS 110553]EXJ61240.1 hypothetical protein A1O5_12032 [Cladophialophora psammophila CBS 110553]